MKHLSYLLWFSILFYVLTSCTALHKKDTHKSIEPSITHEIKIDFMDFQYGDTLHTIKILGFKWRDSLGLIQNHPWPSLRLILNPAPNQKVNVKIFAPFPNRASTHINNYQLLDELNLPQLTHTVDVRYFNDWYTVDITKSEYNYIRVYYGRKYLGVSYNDGEGFE